MRKTAAILLGIITVAAILAPVIAPFGPAEQLDIVGLKNNGPSATHWLGTDAYSRDILSRVLFAARTSLFVAAIATLIATLIGAVWGSVAASVTPRAGEAMMLAVDVIRSVPRMLLFLVAVALAGTLSPTWLAILLGFSAWPAIGRMAFSLVREVRSRSFVEAARAAGNAPYQVVVNHVLPHLTGPMSAAGTLLLADIIALESGLSFLGLGIRPPGASWGNMVQDSLPYLGSAWWAAAVPCTCLLMTVLSASSLADQLQERYRAA